MMPWVVWGFLLLLAIFLLAMALVGAWMASEESISFPLLLLIIAAGAGIGIYYLIAAPFVGEVGG